MDKHKVYGPGDDDYGRNPRLGPSKDNPPIINWDPKYLPSVDSDNNPVPKPSDYITIIRKSEGIQDEFKLVPVYATQDEDGHWYIFPVELKEEFWKDLENEDMVDSGDFDDKWGKYRTGGDLNLVQLYAKL